MRRNDAPDHAILEAWREQGADLVNPLAFHYMAALQRRLDGHQGGTRRVLESKLAALIQAYAGELQGSASSAAKRESTATTHAPGALRLLADEIGSRGTGRIEAMASDDSPETPALADLGALDEFRKLWASVSSDSQMRRSLQRFPTDAGPLNSASLVHRSLALMRELSPGYLQQFLAYVDALSWLEQMKGSGVLGTRDAPVTHHRKPRARAKPRKQRD